MGEPSIQISINGEPRALREGVTVAGLLDTLGVDRALGGIAVAVNAAVIPRSRWEQTALAPGDAVEVIRATAGG